MPDLDPSATPRPTPPGSPTPPAAPPAAPPTPAPPAAAPPKAAPGARPAAAPPARTPPAAPPAAPPAGEPDDDSDSPISFEDSERLGHMLEGMTVKKGVGTKKKLEALAASDPEFAGIVQTMLTDYKKRTSQIAEDRKAIEKEKADLAAARRRMEDENERLRHAVFESGLGLPVQPAPGGEPEAIEEPDWGEVGVDPKAYAEAIRKQVKAEIMAELRGQMPEMLKPVTEPLGRFRESLQREQNKMNVDRIIGETRDWGVLKPEVDAFIVEENKRIEAGAQNYRTSLQNVINIVRGQRAAKVAELDEQRRRSEDTARFAGASAAGRGSGAKPPPVYTPEHRARGITGLREAHDAFIEQGYSEQEISDANPLGVR